MPVFWVFLIIGLFQLAEKILQNVLFVFAVVIHTVYLNTKKPMNFHTVNKLGWKIIMYFLKILTIGRSGFFFHWSIQYRSLQCIFKLCPLSVIVCILFWSLRKEMTDTDRNQCKIRHRTKHIHINKKWLVTTKNNYIVVH